MTRARPLPPDERRRTIIDAATPLLEQFGTDLTTAQVAQAAGIAEGTIFRVFASKSELIYAVVDDAFDTSEIAEQFAALNPEDDLHDRITAVMAILLPYFHRIRSLIFTMHRKLPKSGRRPHRDFNRYRREVAELIGSAIEPWATSMRCSVDTANRYIAALVFDAASGTNEPDRASQLADLLCYGLEGSC